MMTDLKMSKKDMGKDMASTVVDRNPYPYGTRLNLDADTLEKLGINELPEVGEEFHINAMGKVTSVSEADSGNGKRQDLSIQIEKMELMHQDEREDGHEDVASEKAQAAESRSVGGKPKTVLQNAYRGRK